MLLKKENIEDILELTSMQQGLLYNYVSDATSSLYQEQMSITLKGIIDIELIKDSWNKVVENNEMLRTIFKWEKINKPVQIVLKKYDIPFEVIDLSKELDIDNEFDKVFRVKQKENINIQKESIRIIICRLNENTANIIVKNHHILYDGWSTGIILKDFMQYYNSYLVGEKPLNKDKNKFKNYIKYIKTQNKYEAEKFWSEYLGDIEYAVESVDKNEVKDFKKYTYKFSEETEILLDLYGKKENVSKATILYTIWGILQGKYTAQNDIVFGTPVSGRVEKVQGINDMVGLFINTIPLRIKLSHNQEINKLIKEVDKGLKQRLTYENTSLIDIKKYSNISNQNMLFDNIMVIENYPLDKSIYEDNLAKVTNYRIYEYTDFDLTIELITFDNLEMNILYNSNVFNSKYIEIMAKHYEKLIKQSLKETEKLVSDLEIVDDNERNKILTEFNDTYVEYPKNKTIHKLFEEQVDKTPNNIALVSKDKKITYKELNEEANQLATLLRKEYGVKKGDVVSIHLDRSIEMVVAIIAVLKINAVCLPIETKYPIVRVVEMLTDSNAKVVLNNDENLIYSGFIGKILKVDRAKYIKYSKENLIYNIDSEQLGYLIYTSGSTGKPKAVMINHKGIINHAFAKIKETNMTSMDRCCHNLSFNFVASIWQIFSPMFLGCSVYLYEDNIISDGYELFKNIENDKVSIVEVVPSLLNSFLEFEDEKSNKITMKKVRKILLTGERVPVELVNKFYSKYKVNLINAYGQSEFSDDTIHYHIPYDNNTKKILIGKPANNTRIYILDKSNRIVPIGVSGEICISGDGIVKGYLNNKKLTEEKFIDNPYESENKMYKTGDIAKWTLDGNIEFLGRMDQQVKIRGFRIELAEIQNRLSKIEGIKECLVIDKGKYSNKYLSAYYVAEKEINPSSIKEELKKLLPYYMIPSYFNRLEKMPLTPNGKIDRKKLISIEDEVHITTEYEAPRNKIEETLAKIWIEILGVDKIGINDNFFDLGGHSLKATMLMSKIHKELNKEVPLKELFKSPTIKELSKYIESAEENPYSNIEKIEEKEYYKASSAQKRMYMLQQFDKDSMAYNMPVAFELQGKVHKDKIEETFKALILRHEALRTYFVTGDGEIIQKLQNNYKFKLEKRNENGNIEDIINSFIRPFDLEKAPPFRVELVENKEKTYLLIDMHHIISDGLSMGILINDFTEIYNGKALEPLKLQYKDFAAWQNNFLKSEEMKKQEGYWINRFNGQIPVLNMPTDYERSAMQSFEGNSVSLEVNEDITLKLRKLVKETGTTTHMALLSAFTILLSKYSGQEDIVIGTPIAGRPHADLENIMGMFVNTLALRNKPEGSKKYIDFLKEVKENSLKAYENQSYQIEALVEKLDIRRDTSRNPLFDVMFNMVDTVTGGDIKLDDITLKAYCNESKISKFDLILNALEKDNKLNLTIDYCSKLFKKETIERLSNHYVRILDSIVNNLEIKLSEIDLLSESERNKILYEFNNTKTDYPSDKTIHELFEEQVEKTPDNIAIVFEENKLTYRELNERANSLARVLRAKGVEADSIVGIMVERSLEMIVGIMGILKAGGAYLPIDLNYPKERIEYMLRDSNSRILLSSGFLTQNIEFNGEIVDSFNEGLFNNKLGNLEKINNSSNLAYIIYTSGTTGNPKGVMIEHKSLNNYVEYAKNNYLIENKMYMPLYTSVSFDLTVTSIFTPLISGNSIIIYREMEVYKLINNVFSGTDKATIKLTPAHLSLLKEMNNLNKSVDKLIVGGEDLTDKLAKSVSKLFHNKVEIINEYGPTEATVGCIVHKYNYKNKYRNSVLIGKPINNTKIYILDSDRRILPLGVVGEIYIGGDILARGYLNRVELTAEKFVENPFDPGTKMYKTGDLARWLYDGNIELLGRIDNQVKIRGFRIELGEIENRLLQHENIKEAAVLVKENKDGEKNICAYVVGDKNLQEIDLKGYLKETLPEYMVPAYFVELEKMPLTTNGKLDRRALPEPNLDANLTEYEAPRNNIEETLVKIWSEILGVDKIGINDNFFDLGGHSLKAIILMSKIHKELNKEVPLKELFKSPTIKELSKHIESAEENPYSNIEKVEEKEYYEASSAQKRMYMLQQFDKDSMAYNMPVAFELEGKINRDKIEEAFKALALRHEALRTYFATINGEIIQKLQNNYEFKLEKRNEDGNIEDIINSFIRPFDLEKAPLFRVELVENKEKTYLLIDMHHIISDGLSMEILINDFTEVYNGKALEPLKLQYKDFAAWQNNFLKSQEMRKQEEYWINIFNDEIPVLNMPTDYERPAMQSFEGDSVSFEVNEDITLKLRKLVKETGTTTHMALLSAFNILLSRYSGQEDIVIGTPIAGRPHADLQNIMGMFVNTLALRNKPEGSKKYIDFLKEVKENCLKAYENQSYQLEALVEKLDIRRDTSRNPLFDVMFNMVDTVTGGDVKLDDITLKAYCNESKIAKFDLTLNALEKDNKLNFTIDYCSKLFKKETIERLSSHYVRILDSIVNNVEMKLSEVELLSKSERNQILYEFNDTKVDYPKNKTIHELFEEQVEKTPDNIAVVFEDKKLTYRELNERANSLARVLRDKGGESDSIVGIMVERSLEMIVGIMGILKAGGAYLPIDPNYPKERIEYMLKDSNSRILLSSELLTENIRFNGEIIDLFNEELFKDEPSNLEKINNSNNLAYIIYTSGTTGKPKGVMIEHKNINNLVVGLRKDIYSLYDNKLKVALVAPYYFDASVQQIFAVLLSGHSLYITTESTRKNGLELFKYYEANKIDISDGTPIHLSMIKNSLTSDYNLSLKHLIIGGDSLGINTVRDIYKSGVDIRISNVYGPTECCVDSSIFFMDAKIINDLTNISIGKPMANYKIYILNKYNQEMPLGVSGEIYISGDGLARGYLNRQKLTAEKFIENPFEPGTKMYKTGDLARWLPDGNIEFLGRIDNQVKIRGFRIELGEIENRLLQHEDVKEAAVLVKENKNSEKYICAYIVEDKDLQHLDLKDYLKETLPEYMVPDYFVELEKMPLTTNGKLDRRALPEPNLDANLTEYEAPRNKIEETLAKIWSEILGVEKVGINDNFFDLGGHSLKATMLMSKIHKELNKEVPLKELFKSPTIKELSKYIENAKENLYSNIEKVEEKEYYEASSAQKRMYMLQQFDKDSIAYNMPVAFELEGKVHEDKIEETFKALTLRHEALRTYFATIDGEIIQKLQNNYGFKLEKQNENGNIEDIINTFVRPFDLEKVPLFRVELVENKEKTYLLIDMHHIISDGLSMEILINDFTEIYNGKALEPLKLQYKDFAAWQNNFLKAEEMKKQEEYWINRFNDEIPVLNMPNDYERPAMQSFEGDSVSFEVNEDITLKLRKLTKETGTTTHMALLSAFTILLSKYSGQGDIVIGTPIAGRPHDDLQNIMGMFVNTLALRNKPEGSKKYIDFLKEVKENSLKAYENQSYQLEALVEKLDIRRDTSRNPLFDVMFNMVDTVNGGDVKLDDISLKACNSESKIAKFDLTLNALEKGNKLRFTIDYCSKLFKKETIERLSSHYVRILESIVNNLEIKLSEIDLLSESERNQILYEFNDTKVDYPKDKTIQELFEAQVEKTPDNIAVVFEDSKLTYKELNERSNSLARVLRDKGVKADSIVGIMAERSLEMMIGIIGILKAGGAYLPIDPSFPKKRIEYMLRDSESTILLSKNVLAKDINFSGEFIDLLNEDLFCRESSSLDKINSPKNLAYVIYTSGTTGNPKAAMIEHLNLNNFINCFSRQFIHGFGPSDRVLSLTNYVFDVSVCEFFTALINGATLVINDKHKTFDPEEISRLIIDNEIKFTYIPPSLLSSVYEKLKIYKDDVKLKKMLVGVESIRGQILNKFYDLNYDIEIINGYGPTEATICSTFYKVNGSENQNKNVSIGSTIGNTNIYILDKSLNVIPIGIAGELYISGDGVGRGYLNKPELTAEKFIDNPFEVGIKMYKTGDLARWLPNGNIEFLGRVDNQVKIRGFRIELGEIDNRLLQYESIKDVVTIVKENKEKEKYICAYVVSEKELDELDIKSFLKEVLPDYMIPTYFIKLDKIPLNGNGKLDIKLLPEVNLNTSSKLYEAPRNKLEESLVKIWCEVLGAEKIGINDNFFEIGGHSLKATVVIAKIHKQLNKEIPLKELFKYPTIKELSEFIENSKENNYIIIDKIEEKEYYETSSAQKRMYIFQQFNEDSIAYNMPVVFELKGKFDRSKIEDIFKKLILRHESLRTYFEVFNGEIIQRIKDKCEFKLVVRKETANIDEIISKFVKPFNLEEASLLRVELIESKEKSYLLIEMHHIISDGVSMSILIKEFKELYNGQNLEHLKFQYKDFAAWQNKFLKSENMKKQESYWINKFNEKVPLLNIVTDYERPIMRSFHGECVKIEVNKEITQELKKIGKETGTTMHMILLSAFYVFLSKYSGQEDIVVGIPVSGRTHADLENIVGMFVNTLALRNKPQGDKIYVDFLNEIRENSISGYENQNYQFETLVEKLGVEIDVNRNPLFDVMFNSINVLDGDGIKLDDFLMKSYDINRKAAKVDLDLTFIEKSDVIELMLIYSTDLYNQSTVERMIEDYVQILEIIANDAKISIGDMIVKSTESYFDDEMQLDILEEQFNI